MGACYLNPAKKTLDNPQQRARRESCKPLQAGLRLGIFFFHAKCLFWWVVLVCAHTVPACDHGLSMVGSLSCTGLQGLSTVLPLVKRKVLFISKGGNKVEGNHGS